MDLDREAKTDGLIVLVMVIYGIAVIGGTLTMSIAAWLVAALLVLRHVVAPVDELIEGNQTAFMLLLLAILVAGFLLS